MIAALLLAGTCAWMPSYPPDGSGATCTAANEDVECRCSECFFFDAASGTATILEVQRANQDGTTEPIWVFAPAYLDGGIETPHVGIYCPMKEDVPQPREGRKYLYTFLWCSDAGVCSAWSPQIEYRGAPYMVNLFDGTLGNPG